MKGNKGAIRSQAGFTLMEIIIAVTLVALIAVALWGAFRISIRSWSTGTEHMDANQRHRSIMNLVRKQMASTHAVLVPDPERGGAGTLVFNGTETGLSFISLNSLHFQNSPGLTVVSYQVNQDSNGEFALVEREAPYLGRMPDETDPGAETGGILIFRNLSSCVFEYFDPGDSDNPSAWVREWNAQEAGKLPEAVSLTMVSRDPAGRTLNRHMIVPIQAGPNSTAANFINPFGGRGQPGRGARIP